MPKLKINDIELYYEIHGEGEPIVFISGFSADHTAWREIVDKFQENYQVIIFDNRGAGQTDAPLKDYTIEEMAEDVATLCEKLNVKKAHFVGNSMGGFILQVLAYRYPHLVKSAIMSNTAMTTQCCFHLYVAAQLELLKAKAPLATVIKASCTWAFSFRFLTMPGMYDSLIQFSLANPYPFTLQGYEGQYAALERFDSREWVNQIIVPTLVIGSDQDLIFSEATVKLLKSHIPNAKYFSFTECGHLPFIEYPDQFAHVVREFIDT